MDSRAQKKHQPEAADAFIRDILTEEEWEAACHDPVISLEFLSDDWVQERLTVVEVFFAWAGPCTALTAYLRKILVEVRVPCSMVVFRSQQEGEGGVLGFARADADSLPALAVFRASCQARVALQAPRENCCAAGLAGGGRGRAGGKPGRAQRRGHQAAGDGAAGPRPAPAPPSPPHRRPGLTAGRNNTTP